MKKRAVCIVSMLLFLFSFPVLCHAHRVSVFAYQEGGKIVAEGFFSDGTPTRDATIEVYTPDGKKIFSGKTNKKGTLSFKTPEVSPLKIVLIASMGHRAETVFNLKPVAKTQTASGTPVPASAESETQKGIPGITEAKIRAIVREEVDQAVQPVMRTLAQQEAKKVSFADIIGGIGWIIGLMGVWMMLKARKK